MAVIGLFSALPVFGGIIFYTNRVEHRFTSLESNQDRILLDTAESLSGVQDLLISQGVEPTFDRKKELERLQALKEESK